ncbi:MAG: XdhC family protein [Cyanobacteria bacterium P01_A01_bin.105]
MTVLNSQSFYQTLRNQLTQGPVVLATVIAAENDAVGAKLLVWGDAETAGNLDETLAMPLMPPAFEVMKTGLPQQTTLSRNPDSRLRVWLARWQGADAPG